MDGGRGYEVGAGMGGSLGKRSFGYKWGWADLRVFIGCGGIRLVQGNPLLFPYLYIDYYNDQTTNQRIQASGLFFS